MRTNHHRLSYAVLATGLALGLAAAPAAAKEDVYWTTDDDVASSRPSSGGDHNGWTKSPTTGTTAYKMNVPAGATVYLAFLNEDREGKKKTVKVKLTTTVDNLGPFTLDRRGSGGYRGNSTANRVNNWSATSNFKNNSRWDLKFVWPNVCPAWERFCFTNGGDEWALVTVDASSTCGCSTGDSANGLTVTDQAFGTVDGVTEPMEITAVEIYPIHAGVDPSVAPTFSAPAHTGAWSADFSFVDPNDTPRPGGGVRFETDGLGLSTEEYFDFYLRMDDKPYGLYEMFAFDAAQGLWQDFALDVVNTPWAERFDTYEPGTGMIGRRNWVGWNDNDELDGELTEEHARSGSNSLAVRGDTDIVREFHELDGGQWRVSTWTYIPQEMLDTQHFILLNGYPAKWPDGWSLSLQFDGTGGVVRDENSENELPLIRDEWIEIEVLIDLDHDVQRVFYNGDLLTTKNWIGSYGGTGDASFVAIDLWGRGSSASIFYDDLSVEPCNPDTESFEPYRDGSMLHGQGGWKGWNDDPGFSAPITSERASSGEQALDVFGPGTMVHDYCTFGEGAWSYSAWQYIPSDFVSGGEGEMAGSYFMLLNTYQDGGPYDWSVQMQFDSNDQLLKVYHGDGGNTINVPYETDRWVKIQVDVDLDDDWTRVYYDDALITEYSWTGGVYGEGGGALDIAVVDLYAQHSTSVYYDDLRLEPILPAPPCEGDVNGSGTVDFGDVLDVLSAWGECGGCPEDLDEDGFVGFGDLLIVLGAWGPCDD